MDDLDQRRVPMTISLSPKNPDAVAVVRALIDQGIEPRQRSAKLLEWAAAHLEGRAREQAAGPAEDGLSDEDLDALMDDL